MVAIFAYNMITKCLQEIANQIIRVHPRNDYFKVDSHIDMTNAGAENLS